MVKSVSLIKPSQSFAQKAKAKYGFARDLINSYSIFTCEDFQKVKTLQNQYKVHSAEIIKQQLEKNTSSINKYFRMFLNDTKTIGQLVIYNMQDKIPQKLINKIKWFNLNKQALFTLNSFSSQKTITLYPSNIEYVLSPNNQKNLPISAQESLLTHPIDIIQNIIGKHDADNLTANKNFKLYTKFTAADLLKIQFKTLAKISNYIDKKGNHQNFIYTNRDFKELKSLMLKYWTIDKFLNRQNIDVKNIETLFFHPLLPKNIKIGDTLPNSDIVIDKIKVHDIEEQRDVSAIMTFANTSSGYRLKAYRYDEELFIQIDKLKKQFKMYLAQNKIDNLKQLSVKSAKLINNSEIAEVFFQEKNRNEMFSILKETKLLSDEKINDVLKAEQEFVFIRNLKNYNIKKYFNVSLPIIKNLKAILGNNKDFGTIFINALAYNNVKRSPALLYLRAGCKPISHSIDEVKELLKKPSETFEKPILFIHNKSYI